MALGGAAKEQSEGEQPFGWFLEAMATLPNSNVVNFSFKLTLQGEDVQIDNFGQDKQSHGKFRDGKLTLTLETGDDTYGLEARMEQRSLVGTWHKHGAEDHGTWSASPMDTNLDTNSTAVLIEYRRLSDQRIDYFIQSPPPPGYQPTGHELCQVWKAPNSVLALNWNAKSMPRDVASRHTNEPPVKTH